MSKNANNASSYDQVRGLPIGNLTSQIMANVYLNELDRLIQHTLRPFAYMRYGDDFICFTATQNEAEIIRVQSIAFLRQTLSLRINPKLDVLRPVCKGVSYLGIDFWPSGRRLNARMRHRIDNRLNATNFASYEALILAHEKNKKHKQLQWRLLEDLKNQSKP